MLKYTFRELTQHIEQGNVVVDAVGRGRTVVPAAHRLSPETMNTYPFLVCDSKATEFVGTADWGEVKWDVS